MLWKWYDVRIVSIGIENCQRTVELNILISAIARKVFTVMVIIGSALTGKGEMMPRYIDADALMKEFIDFVRDSNNSDFAPAPNWNDAVSLVGSAPTADVVERKQGEWIKMSDADGVYYTCGECGEDIPRVSHYDPQFDLFPRLESIEKTNFCPNCGADMREEIEDE